MGKKEKERLIQTLNSHLNNIHETFQALHHTPSASSLTKGSWDDVVKMGDHLYKQATIVGMLWTGEKPEAKAIEENMATYFNTLQGLLLFSHGSMVGAGPTLASSIHASIKQVIDCSFRLMTETVSSYGSYSDDLRLIVPQLVGGVWEACSALKKTPATNVTAIGRAMTKVAVTVKDVLREMNELKLNTSDEVDKDDDMLLENDNPSDDELGNDLSEEDMQVAQLAINVVSDTVLVIKELIRTITGLIKKGKPDDNGDFIDSLEKLLKQCQEIGEQIDELGACLYPPQEVPTMKSALEKISINLNGIRLVMDSFEISSDAFSQACNSLKSSVKQMESELECSDMAEVEAKMKNVTVSE